MNSTNLSDPLNLFASFVMTLNGVFGIVCNGLIVYIFARSPTERSSFTLICVFRAIGNIFILGWAFLATFVPMTVISDTLFPLIYQFIVITSVTSIYKALQYSGILVAINRFCAMYFPIWYSSLFSLKATFVFLILLYGYRIGKMIREFIIYIPLKCFSYYSVQDLTWVPAINYAGCHERSASYFINGTAAFLAVLVVFNIATLVKIHLFYKSTEISERDTKRKMRKNHILFWQTVIQDVTYLIDMVFTFQLGELIEERYWTFLSGTFIWQCVHSFDGLIMIMFNERLTFIKSALFATSINASKVGPSKMTMTATRSMMAPVD